MLEKLSFSKRLLLSSLVLVALTLMVGLFSLWQLASVNHTSTVIADNWLPSLRIATDLNTLTADYRIAQFNHVASKTTSEMTDRENKLTKLGDDIEALLQSYRPYIVKPQETALLNSVEADWKKYEALHSRIVELSRANNNEEALNLVRGEGYLLYNKFSEDLDMLEEINALGAQEASNLGDILYANSRSWIIGLLLLSLICGVALSLILRRYTINLLGAEPQVIRELVAELAAGKLNVTIPNASKSSKSVTRHIAEMRKSMRATLRDVREANKEVNETAKELSKVVKASNAIVDEQSSRTQTIATAMEEMVASFQEVASSVNTAAENTHQTQEITHSGVKDMQHLKDQVANLASELQAVIEAVTTVESHTGQIGTILAAIRGIADQTNLLALNAAIEAARAGEMGRGFAVVADEVRSLAQRSQESTKEIDEIIGQLSRSVASTVEAMQTGNALVEELVQKAGDTQSQFAIISNQTQSIHDRTAQIATASEEQSATASEINQGILRINTRSTDLSGQVHRISNEVTDLIELADKLNQRMAFFDLSQ